MRQSVLCMALMLSMFWGALAQSNPDNNFYPIFDGTTLNGWVVSAPQYADNFSVNDGAISVKGTGGWLRSSEQYSDFILRFQVRFVTDDAVSGVFVRTPGQSTFGSGWPSDSMEIALLKMPARLPPDTPGDPRWFGAIVRRSTSEGETAFYSDAAISAYREPGEWKTCEIEAAGQRVTMKLNGFILTRAYRVRNLTGYIGLRAGAGTTEYRSVSIRKGRLWDASDEMPGSHD